MMVLSACRGHFPKELEHLFFGIVFDVAMFFWEEISNVFKSIARFEYPDLFLVFFGAFAKGSKSRLTG